MFLRRGLHLFICMGAWLTVAACSHGSPAGPCTTCEPPVGPVAITCPASLSVDAPSYTTTSVNVTYAAPATTGGTPPVAVACSAASNSAFPAGKTTVTCTATDSINRTAVCTFDVTVNVPAPPIPQLQATRFLAFGDSLTAGEDGTLTSSSAPYNAWTIIDVGYDYGTILKGLLAARYTLQTPVVTTKGFAGETAYTSSQHLPADIDAIQPKPEVLLLMDGVNDFYGLPVLSRDGPPVVANVKEYLRWDIQQAKARGMKVFITTLPPEIFGRSRAWLVNGDLNLLDLMNNAIKNLASEENAFLVDGFSALKANVSANIADDGLHMTRDGRTALANAFLASIEQHLETTPSAIRPTFGRPRIK